MYKIYTDGGSRGNPGKAASGFLIFDENNQIYTLGGEYLGIQTNNFAEYSALILALKTSIKEKLRDVECYLDSELVVKQLNGEYKVKDMNISKLFSQVDELRKMFNHISFNHIPRSENKFADKIVNTILDSVN